MVGRVGPVSRGAPSLRPVSLGWHIATIILLSSLFSVAVGAGAMLVDGHERLQSQAVIDRQREGADAAAELSTIWHETGGRLIGLASALGDQPTQETFGAAVSRLDVLQGPVVAVRYITNETAWQRPMGPVLPGPLQSLEITGGRLEAAYTAAGIQRILDRHAARLTPSATMFWAPNGDGVDVAGLGGAIIVEQEGIGWLTVDRATMWRAGGTGIAVGAACIAGTLIASTVLVRPLRRIQDDARQLAAGGRPARRGGPKEIAHISASMNEAAAEVARERQALQLAQEKLGADLRRQTRSLADQEVRLRRLYEGISHDIKGPLITANVLLQQTQRDAPRHDERLDRAMVALDRLRDLVGQLGLLSRAGTEPDNRLFDVAPLIQRAAAAAEDIVNRRGRSVTLSGPAMAIRTDIDRLETVVTLLVDNGLRHGGNVRIRWARGPVFCISISDDGPGFDFDPAMFEPFAVRSDRPGVAAGLGLAIAHRLVHSLGGGLQMNSDANGTRCSIFLPEAA